MERDCTSPWRGRLSRDRVRGQASVPAIARETLAADEARCLAAPACGSRDARLAAESGSPASLRLVGQRRHQLFDRRRSHDRAVIAGRGGRRCSPATMPGYHAGRPPRNKGIRYPADPPTVDEIVAVMRHTADDRHGFRLRAMIVVLWRAGLRIHEALALAEHDLDQRRGSVLVRSGKGGRRREVGMDEWGWEQVRPWLSARADMPAGPLFCIIDGPTRGRPWPALPSAASSAASPRKQASGGGSLAPAAPRARARARARPRGRAAEHHPAPARAFEPRHDLDLSPRHRSRGDPRRRPCTARADDVGQRRAPALIDPIRSGSVSALPLSPDVSRRVARCYAYCSRSSSASVEGGATHALAAPRMRASSARCHAGIAPLASPVCRAT